MKTQKLPDVLFLLVIITSLYACTSIPDGAKAVTSFDKKRYLGKWFEIARLDFKYEKDLNNTTANYSLNQNGTIQVVNRGYNTKTGEWKQVTGKAKFAGDENTAMLKVSFFGPFYSGYNVIAIDPEYRFALVAGANLKYLWILSRETTLPVEIKEKYLKMATEIGYHTNELLWVQHEQQK